jgi:DNA-binding transcriptional LysR family regulator
MNIPAIDLNRLLVLHTVLVERSVTRAAATLHVTPSAISNALARLRTTFDDPLLVRSGRGLVLTPRAVALAPQLANAVAAMARVVEGQPGFDPARSTRTFTLACSDAEQISEVPRIAAAFARKLPNATLRVMSVDQLESKGGLASAEVDAAIAPAHRPLPANGLLPDVYASDLYEEEAVLVVRKSHPEVLRRMSKEQFNTLRHIDILLALDGPGIGHRIVEEYLASQGLNRHIAVSVPSFAAAAAIAAQTNWVAGMPRRMATVFLRQMPLQRGHAGSGGAISYSTRVARAHAQGRRRAVLPCAGSGCRAGQGRAGHRDFPGAKGTQGVIWDGARTEVTPRFRRVLETVRCSAPCPCVFPPTTLRRHCSASPRSRSRRQCSSSWTCQDAAVVIA